MLLPDVTGGGAERVALHLISHWIEAGHEVDLVLLRPRGDLLALVPPQARIVDLGTERMRSALLPLARYLRERRPHAVHASMWPMPILALAAKRLARVPTRVVASEHTALSKQYANRGAIHALLLRNSIAWFYPRADVRIAVSHDAADDLAQLAGLDRRSIEVVYNPVSIPAPPARSAERDEPLWPAASGRILCVGRMTAEKNHALLLRAFAELRRRRPATLMLVGQGPLRGELERLAAELGIADDVIFRGFVLDPHPFYASADLFALPSNLEGYPLVLVEALLHGLPVVSTDCRSGPREILDNGRFGTLVACNDVPGFAAALEACLSRPPDALALQARGAALAGDQVLRRHTELMTGDTA